jgi:Zn-dependent alcohol dehydrogenase
MRIAPADLTREEKSIVGSYYGSSDPPRDFARIFALFAAGRLPLDRLVTRTYALAQVNDAFGDLVAGRLLRGVIELG